MEDIFLSENGSRGLFPGRPKNLIFSPTFFLCEFFFAWALFESTFLKNFQPSQHFVTLKIFPRMFNHFLLLEPAQRAVNLTSDVTYSKCIRIFLETHCNGSNLSFCEFPKNLEASKTVYSYANLDMSSRLGTFRSKF